VTVTDPPGAPGAGFGDEHPGETAATPTAAAAPASCKNSRRLHPFIA
jgi:hypothetical protein